MALNRDLIAQTELLDDSGRVVLDMDSSESPVHGRLGLVGIRGIRGIRGWFANTYRSGVPRPRPVGHWPCDRWYEDL